MAAFNPHHQQIRPMEHGSDATIWFLVGLIDPLMTPFYNPFFGLIELRRFGRIFMIAFLKLMYLGLQQGTLNVSQYFTQLKSLQDEFDNYRTILICKCSIPYTCEATQAIRNTEIKIVPFVSSKG